MTTKEKVLQKLKEQAKAYNDAYETMKGLPDIVFESFKFENDVLPMQENKEVKEVLQVANEYGGSTNRLRQMLADAGHKGLSKGQMVKGFPETPDRYAVVTNALTWLKQKGEVESYKPENVTMKGFIWRLKK